MMASGGHRYTECLEEVERLVQHIAVPEVVAALGDSSARDVYVCLSSAFVKFGVAAAARGNGRDAEAFFCYGMTVADSTPVSALRGLLRAWIFDSMAFGHYQAGNCTLSLAALDAGLNELQEAASGRAEDTTVESSFRSQEESSEVAECTDDSVVISKTIDSEELSPVQAAAGAAQSEEDVVEMPSARMDDEAQVASERQWVKEVRYREMDVVIQAHRIEVLLKMARSSPTVLHCTVVLGIGKCRIVDTGSLPGKQVVGCSGNGTSTLQGYSIFAFILVFCRTQSQSRQPP